MRKSSLCWVRPMLFTAVAGALAVGSVPAADADDEAARERIFIVVDDDSAAALDADRLAFEKVVLGADRFELAGTKEMEALYADCGADIGVDAQTQRDCQLRAANRVMVTQILVLSGRKLDEGRYAVDIEVWSPETNGKLWGERVEAEAKSLERAGRQALPELAGRYLCWRGEHSACADGATGGAEAPAALTTRDTMKFIEGRSVSLGSTHAQVEAAVELCKRDLGEGPTCRAHAFDDEVEARREVAVGSFYLDVHEVTVEAWAACEAAGGCQPRDLSRCYDGGNTLDDDKGNHPVNCVTWYQARDYCAWVDKRLPTSAEWTLAAKSAGDVLFPWGNDHPSAFDEPVANLADATLTKVDASRGAVADYDDGFANTAPVGSFALDATPDGIYDLGGNVQEWVSDVEVDTLGGERRAKRGGGWLLTSFVARTGFVRSTAPSDHADAAVGFRCAQDP